VVFASCVASSIRPNGLRAGLPQTDLPEFIDDPAHITNMDLSTPRQEMVYERNYGAIIEILKHDSTVVREEMARRLNSKQSMPLKLLAAAVLVLENDDRGKQFLQSQASVIESELEDVYVTLSEVDLSGPFLNDTDVDMSWAEDLMVAALQNKTQLNRRETLPTIRRNIPFTVPTVEVRELAIRHGRFPEILGKMHSEKALPVFISMIREGRQLHSMDTTMVRALGHYKDKRVEPLLLEILAQYRESKHYDIYGSAVGAATDLGLKSAVPILLKHLNDYDSYSGLTALADKTAIPVIERALPSLKPEVRAEAEITLIHLRGGDVLPALLRLLSRSNFPERSEVMMWLAELKDTRSVPLMTAYLCDDPDYYVRSEAIRVLAAVKTKEAILGLVNGLGCDYSKLQPGKVAPDHDNNRQFRETIQKTLVEITGKDFGTDKTKWLDWLDQQKLSGSLN
jgi:HEAT repeat protein